MRRCNGELALAICLCLARLTCGLAQEAEDVRPLAQANNQFACNLYEKLAARGGNVCFSPYSISLVLALTSAGAKGATATEMLKALSLDSARAGAPHASFAKLTQGLVSKGDGCQLDIANGVWVRRGEPPREAFVGIAQQQYGAEIKDVDFQNDADGARKEINSWVAKKTRDKITDILAPGTLNDKTTLVLANAVYFNGKWVTEFKKEHTASHYFALQSGQDVAVPMMYQMTYFQYATNDVCQILEMPYRDTSVSMVVLLPQKVDGLGKLEASLSAATLSGWLQGMRRTAVAVYMPRFTLGGDYDLIPMLRDLGMKRAFAGEADFSGICSGPLFVSLIKHRSYVDVNEAGTEATAATVVALSKNGGRHPVYFRADHPFLFLLRDTKSGAILFIGRLEDPPERTSEKPRESARQPGNDERRFKK